jgi:isopentenyl-diphosphate delta-isomerase
MANLILVDEKNTPVGEATWQEAHDSPGKLHRAFSAYVFRKGGNEILIQRRSAKKPLWALVWANTCCSHPRVGEEIIDIAPRRLGEELGFRVPLRERAHFVYRAEDPNGNGVEHEHVTILTGTAPDDIEIFSDPREVDEWKWMNVDELLADMELRPHLFAPWFHEGLNMIV